jgi:catechol 2,3-dioxygenase-like lactoylglutathione lyase family enzyme
MDDPTVPDDEELFHYYRHTAFEVDDLREVCRRGVENGYLTFQMDIHGEESVIEASDAPLDFGLKTVFVRDPDGNLWEFAQRGLSWEKLWE